MAPNSALEVLLSFSTGVVLALVCIGLHKGLKRLLGGNKDVSTLAITAYYSNRLNLDETMRRGNHLLLALHKDDQYSKKITLLVDKE